MIPAPPDWLERASQSAPGTPALEGAGGRLTYRSLERVAHGLAAPLAEAAGKSGPLALTLTSRWHTALTVHAALQAGHMLLPLDPRLPVASRNRLLEMAGVKTLISEPLAGGAGRPSGAAPAGPPSRSRKTAPAPAKDHGIRLIVPTSGSSGEPKGAMLTDANLAAAVRAARRRIPLEPGDCWLACLPLFHIGGLAILLRCLESEATVLLHERFEPREVWRALLERPVTHLSLVPTLLQRLLDTAGGRRPPDRLRTVLVGGAALQPALAHRAQVAGWPLCVSYGMSETASQLATLCGPGAGLEGGRVGRPLDGMEVRITGADDIGVGRIGVRGPALMAGYANPQLTHGQGLQGEWFETGDLGRLAPDGNLWVLGRADDLLLSGGERIHPAQVEPSLLTCPGVETAAVSALADPLWGERLVAVYSGSAEPAAVEACCRTQLEGPWLPRLYLRVEHLPLTGSGKPDRRRLRRWVAELLSPG